MTYVFKCPACSRTKEIKDQHGYGPPPNPECDWCQMRMHRVYSVNIVWPKDQRGH